MLQSEVESKEGSEAGSSSSNLGLLDQLIAANAQIKQLKHVQLAKLAATEKVQAEHTKSIAFFKNAMMFLSQKYPDFVFPPPPPPKDD